MPKKNKQKVKPPIKKPVQVTAPATKAQKVARKLPESRNFFSQNWRQLSVISLLAFLLYIESVGFDYVLDDTILIVENKFTQKGINGIGDIFKYESFRGYFGEQKDLVEG